MGSSQDHIEELFKELFRLRDDDDSSYLIAAKNLVTECERHGSAQKLGEAYYYLAEAMYVTGDKDHEFTTTILKTIACQEQAHDSLMLAHSYNLLAVDAGVKNDTILNFDYLLTALKYCKDLTSPKDASFNSVVLYNLGYLYGELDQYKKALTYLDMAEEFQLKNPNVERRPLYLFSIKLGKATYKLGAGDLDGAIKEAKAMHSYIIKEENGRASAQEYFAKAVDLKISHAQHDDKKTARIAREIIDFLKETSPNANYLEGVADTASDLISFGYLDEAKKFLDVAHGMAAELQIDNLMRVILRQQIRLARLTNQTEDLSELLEEHFNCVVNMEDDNKHSVIYSLDLRQSVDELRSKTKKIQKENTRLAQEAEYDQLTRLPNRYLFNAHAQEAFDRARANNASLGVEIMDIDDFKMYNDRFGHAAGDMVLMAIADCLRSIVIEYSDVFASRWGGDEFVLIYSNKTDKEILEIAAALEKKVSMIVLNEGEASDIHVGISQGIRNSVPTDTNHIWDFMSSADDALYLCKKREKGGIFLTDHYLPSSQEEEIASSLQKR